jgi:SAM-dependent methyltransferase
MNRARGSGLKRMLFRGDDIVGDIRRKYGAGGGLAEIYAGTGGGAAVSKWHHYIPLYERYLARFRGTSFRFLEIGVSAGGSLQMWRKYFGPKATIFGIDINPECRAFNGKAGEVRIGSQTNAEFLQGTVARMGGLDVVLDDGSHQMAHVRKSLRVLLPLVGDGGLYMIEDMHTAYLEGFGGGANSEANVFNDVRGLIDDLHRWYHQKPLHAPSLRDSFTGIHVHDSMIVIEKGKALPPVYSLVEGAA